MVGDYEDESSPAGIEIPCPQRHRAFSIDAWQESRKQAQPVACHSPQTQQSFSFPRDSFMSQAAPTNDVTCSHEVVLSPTATSDSINHIFPSKLRIKATELEVTNVVLGHGSYGEVRLGRYRGSHVAVKIPHQELQHYKSVLQCFLHECYQLSEMRHPNILQFMGIANLNGSLVLVTELMKRNLTTFLESPCGKETSITKKLEIIQDIAKGLAYVHACDPPLVHKDLTSNNILLTADLTAKISDFGAARLYDPNKQSCTRCPGNVVYMPPEVLHVPVPDGSPSIDIFSVGVLIGQTITGEFPNPTREFEQVSQHGDYRRLSEIERRSTQLQQMKRILEENGGPMELYRLACQCLDDNPQNRPSALDIVARLDCMINPKENPALETEPYLRPLDMLQRTQRFSQLCTPSPVHCCTRSSIDHTQPSKCFSTEVTQPCDRTLLSDSYPPEMTSASTVAGPPDSPKVGLATCFPEPVDNPTTNTSTSQHSEEFPVHSPSYSELVDTSPSARIDEEPPQNPSPADRYELAEAPVSESEFSEHSSQSEHRDPITGQWLPNRSAECEESNPIEETPSSETITQRDRIQTENPNLRNQETTRSLDSQQRSCKNANTSTSHINLSRNNCAGVSNSISYNTIAVATNALEKNALPKPPFPSVECIPPGVSDLQPQSSSSNTAEDDEQQVSETRDTNTAAVLVQSVEESGITVSPENPSCSDECLKDSITPLASPNQTCKLYSEYHNQFPEVPRPLPSSQTAVAKCAAIDLCSDTQSQFSMSNDLSWKAPEDFLSPVHDPSCEGGLFLAAFFCYSMTQFLKFSFQLFFQLQTKNQRLTVATVKAPKTVVTTVRSSETGCSQYPKPVMPKFMLKDKISCKALSQIWDEPTVNATTATNYDRSDLQLRESFDLTCLDFYLQLLSTHTSEMVNKQCYNTVTPTEPTLELCSKVCDIMSPENTEESSKEAPVCAESVSITCTIPQSSTDANQDEPEVNVTVSHQASQLLCDYSPTSRNKLLPSLMRIQLARYLYILQSLDDFLEISPSTPTAKHPSSSQHLLSTDSTWEPPEDILVHSPICNPLCIYSNSISVIYMIHCLTQVFRLIWLQLCQLQADALQVNGLSEVSMPTPSMVTPQSSCHSQYLVVMTKSSVSESIHKLSCNHLNQISENSPVPAASNSEDNVALQLQHPMMVPLSSLTPSEDSLLPTHSNSWLWIIQDFIKNALMEFVKNLHLSKERTQNLCRSRHTLPSISHNPELFLYHAMGAQITYQLLQSRDLPSSIQPNFNLEANGLLMDQDFLLAVHAYNRSKRMLSSTDAFNSLTQIAPQHSITYQQCLGASFQLPWGTQTNKSSILVPRCPRALSDLELIFTKYVPSVYQNIVTWDIARSICNANDASNINLTMNPQQLWHRKSFENIRAPGLGHTRMKSPHRRDMLPSSSQCIASSSVKPRERRRNVVICLPKQAKVRHCPEDSGGKASGYSHSQSSSGSKNSKKSGSPSGGSGSDSSPGESDDDHQDDEDRDHNDPNPSHSDRESTSMSEKEEEELSTLSSEDTHPEQSLQCIPRPLHYSETTDSLQYDPKNSTLDGKDESEQPTEDVSAKSKDHASPANFYSEGESEMPPKKPPEKSTVLQPNAEGKYTLQMNTAKKKAEATSTSYSSDSELEMPFKTPPEKSTVLQPSAEGEYPPPVDTAKKKAEATSASESELEMPSMKPPEKNTILQQNAEGEYPPPVDTAKKKADATSTSLYGESESEMPSKKPPEKNVLQTSAEGGYPPASFYGDSELKMPSMKPSEKGTVLQPNTEGKYMPPMDTAKKKAEATSTSLYGESEPVMPSMKLPEKNTILQQNAEGEYPPLVDTAKKKTAASLYGDSESKMPSKRPPENIAVISGMMYPLTKSSPQPQCPVQINTFQSLLQKQESDTDSTASSDSESVAEDGISVDEEAQEEPNRNPAEELPNEDLPQQSFLQVSSVVKVFPGPHSDESTMHDSDTVNLNAVMEEQGPYGMLDSGCSELVMGGTFSGAAESSQGLTSTEPSLKKLKLDSFSDDVSSETLPPSIVCFTGQAQVTEHHLQEPWAPDAVMEKSTSELYLSHAYGDPSPFIAASVCSGKLCLTHYQ